jgi:hypothetical protein
MRETGFDFPEDKEDKTDREEGKLRMFKENDFIEGTLDSNFGRIIQINPELETVFGISKTQEAVPQLPSNPL